MAQAKEYMDKYFQHYAGVRAYMDAVVEQAKGTAMCPPCSAAAVGA